MSDVPLSAVPPWTADRPGPKALRSGTHRAAALDDTWARIRPLLPVFGVTRLADITGLDTIGVPVTTAYRPNSRSLAVSQGKGVTRRASRVSAAMEAIEHAHGERIDLPLRLARYAELPSPVEPWRLPRTQAQTVDEHTPLLWLEGRSLYDGAPVDVPFEAVSIDFTLPRGLTAAGLCRDSNGLAGGNTALEAVVHALCEAIERDAFALWELRPPGRQAADAIAPRSFGDPDVDRLLDRFEAAGVETALFDITSDIAVPAMLCQIVEADPDPFRPLPPAAGLGCHPHPAVAAARALTEAAQSRLIAVSGARDDLTRDAYHGADDLAAGTALRDLLRTRDPAARPYGGPGADHGTLGADLDWLLDRLAAAGLPEVVAVDLTRPGAGLPVLKVLVPGLEGAAALSGAAAVPGPRARETADV
ncbi:YcaO-like family protein [Actinomadura sediminis]|uniref:YcaO-like family protein n=1 Tax=Actinomadura sediminis TaxID=1038904 RepID=A0ABW3EGF1_9ACTN